MNKTINKTLRKHLPLFYLKWQIAIKFSKSRKYQGLYQEIDTYHNTFASMHLITLSTKLNPTKRDVVETLLHELVHAHQNENNNTVGHKRSFKRWKKYIKQTLGYKI